MTFRRRDELQRMIQEQCLHTHPEGYLLASGQRSPYYLDLRPLTMSGDGLSIVSEALYDRYIWLCLQDRFCRVGQVGGVPLGGAPLVAGLLLAAYRDLGQLSTPYGGFLVRDETKQHGIGSQLFGNTTPRAPGDKGQCMLLEDVVTTGGSLIKAAKTIRKAGLTPCQVLCIVCRGPGATAALAAENIKLESLFHISDFEIPA